MMKITYCLRQLAEEGISLIHRNCWVDGRSNILEKQVTGTDSLASPNIYNEPALKEKRALLESVGISLFNSKYQEEFL